MTIALWTAQSVTASVEFGLDTGYGMTAADAAPSAVHQILLSGLAPATTYHYRLVAHNRHGLVTGADRTFKSKPQPLGVSLAATPNPMPFGSPVTLAGQLTGTGNGNRQVVLQSNPFPYTQGFQNASNVQVTDAAGNFSFPLLSVPLSTQYRVQMPQKPAVVSPIVSLGVAVTLTTHVSAHLRFSDAAIVAAPGSVHWRFTLERGTSNGCTQRTEGVFSSEGQPKSRERRLGRRVHRSTGS